jgi:hypothetical protein
MKFEGSEEAAFALIASANLERRELSKAQKAMAMAFMYPEPGKGGRGIKGKATESDGFSQIRLKEARSILAYSEELATDVLLGTAKLDKALADVATLKKQKLTHEAFVRQIGERHPDLAQLVRDRELTLDEATARGRQRDEELAAQRENSRRFLTAVAQSAAAFANKNFCETIRRDLTDKTFRDKFDFRSTFRDWFEEMTAFSGSVAEAALARVVGDKVEAAYQRGDLFEKRRKLMARGRRSV